MTDTHSHTALAGDQVPASACREADSKSSKSKMSKSMHDGVEVWCDCCSCEAEPYWIEAMESYNNSLSDDKT